MQFDVPVQSVAQFNDAAPLYISVAVTNYTSVEVFCDYYHRSHDSSPSYMFRIVRHGKRVPLDEDGKRSWGFLNEVIRKLPVKQRMRVWISLRSYASLGTEAMLPKAMS